MNSLPRKITAAVAGLVAVGALSVGAAPAAHAAPPTDAAGDVLEVFGNVPAWAKKSVDLRKATSSASGSTVTVTIKVTDLVNPRPIRDGSRSSYTTVATGVKYKTRGNTYTAWAELNSNGTFSSCIRNAHGSVVSCDATATYSTSGDTFKISIPDRLLGRTVTLIEAVGDTRDFYENFWGYDGMKLGNKVLRP